MRVIVAGSRDWQDVNVIHKELNNIKHKISCLLCGMCCGADLIGFKWAILNNIMICKYPANWKKYGKKAGPLRNQVMINNKT